MVAESTFRERYLQGRMVTLQEVDEELSRQMHKWGVQSHPQAIWYAILGEEFGEVGKSICEYALAGRGVNGLAELRQELVQTAAVALAMAESLDRVGFDGA